MQYEGFILIADITGYTSYLTRSELEHAQETLTELLELLIEHTPPPLVVAQLEGDAVMSYGLREGFVSAQTFIEMIEETYIAFRRAIELMVLNNTCRCNACANVSSLDLKFFVHFGSFAMQELDDRKQLVGNDVNLVHRLLKNSVTADTGIRAYILCTDAAAKALQIEDATETMVLHVEDVDGFGEVEVWIKNMHTVFEERQEGHEITFAPDEIVDMVQTEIPLPPELVWDYVNQSEFRDVLISSDRHEVENRKNGRVAVGSSYQCYHGNRVITQVVVEWRPSERVVLQMLLPFPGRECYVHFDFRLTPIEDGTLLSSTIGKVTGPHLKRLLARFMLRSMHRRTQHEIDAFRDLILEDQASRNVGAVEPDPVSYASISDAAASALGDTREAPGKG